MQCSSVLLNVLLSAAERVSAVSGVVAFHIRVPPAHAWEGTQCAVLTFQI